MSLDKFASADGKLPQQPAFSAAPEESDEDLFNFDELTADLAKPAQAKAELDKALQKVEQAKQEVARVVVPAPSATPAAGAAAPAPAAAAPRAPAAAAPSTTARAPRMIPAVADDLAPASGAPNVVLVPQRLTMSPVAAALLGGVVLANVALMAFAWRSVSATRDMVLDVANDVREASADLRDESQQRTTFAARESEPAFGALPEGFRTLEAARELIAQGEHARARRMLHGLLAVIDRVQQPARGEIEARASFLVADSYRLEGDALAKAAEERK